MYTVIVETKVVNSMGELVDHAGWAHMNPERKFSPLRTEQRIVTFEDIKKAHKALNGVHRLIDAAKELV
jgi:hypothetical protein